MKKLLIGLLLLPSLAYAATAYFSHEVRTGGMTKQCVYTYLGSTYVITISAIKLCPLTIEV